MRTPSFALALAALSGACGGMPADPELKAPLTTVSETPVGSPPVISRSCKPEPPVNVELASRPLGGGRYEVTALATPSAAVASLEVRLVTTGARIEGKAREAFGATAIAERRAMTTVVELTDRRGEIAAVVAVPVEGIAMTKSALVTLGEPKPLPVTRVYALPDGERAREVRP